MNLRLTLLLLIIPTFLYSQELSNIAKSPLLQVTGGMSVNQVYTWSDLPGAYSQPYAYTIAGNMNFAIYGWSIPVSGVFSNKRWSYQQPFNMVSINPSYKWIRLYLGDNSMSFSSYTLSGHRFFGGGVELSPTGGWKFSAMAGRMQQRVLPDTSGRIIPQYYRFGSGFKTEYSYSGGNIGISTFYGRDDANSLLGYDSLKVTPNENIAISLTGNINLFKTLTLGGEYATSIFTEDMNSLNASDKYIIPGFTKRTSSHRYNAIKGNLTYNSPIGSIGIAAERVAPGYKTLGAYNTVNDFLNYTFNFATQVIKDKVSFASSIGIQQDDLEKIKAQNNKRTVGSVNVGFTPVKSINATLSYGNFRNFTHIRSGFENINNTTPYPTADTLDYTQISENVNASVSFSPTSNENVTRSYLVSATYQQATEQQSDDLNHSQNTFFNGMLGYNQSMKKRNFTFSSGINFNHNKADSIITLTIGPSISARKQFLDKKLSTNISLAYNQSLLNNKAQSEVYIIRAGCGYTLKDKHVFDLSAIIANRHNMIKSSRNNDLTITLTYRYMFKAITIDFKKKNNTSKSIESDSKNKNGVL